ncbi:hypothetical protein GGF31_004113 [Allomyces arbusculus]|nr:hypothetical protein GGF31_004113 [Allomyces arbusculus]
MAANAQPNLPQSWIEALPTVVHNVIMDRLATTDRVALIQFARASPALYASAIRTAVRTAPAHWSWLTVDAKTRRPAPCRGSLELVGSLGACITTWRLPLETSVYLIPSVGVFSATDIRRVDDHPIGPISRRDLRSLFIGQNITPSFVVATLPHVRRIAWSMREIDVTASRTLVDAIALAGGIPDAVTDVDVLLPDTKPWADDEKAVVARLARLVAASRIRNLTFTQDRAQWRSMATVEWPPPLSIQIPVASVFLDEGLPQTTLTTLRIQLAKGWARGSHDAVQWPPSLRCIELDLQTRFGDVHVVNLLVSLSGADLPHLDALVLNNVAESVSIVDAIIAVLRPSLTVLCVGAVFPAVPVATNNSILAARFRALIDGAAAKCPNLKRLHLFPASCTVSAVDRTAVVADVIPRLRTLANLTDISLCEWGMMATGEAVFLALATAVPNLRRLDLSNNRWITGQVVPLLLPLIERGNVVGINLTGTLVDRSGRDQVAAAIKRARQKRCAAAAAVDAA